MQRLKDYYSLNPVVRVACTPRQMILQVYKSETGHFPKTYLTKLQLPKGILPRRVATSQSCNFPSGNFQSLFWPQRSASQSVQTNAQLKGLVSITAYGALEDLIYPFESYRLGIIQIIKVAVGKIPLESCRLVKGLREIPNNPFEVTIIHLTTETFYVRINGSILTRI